MYSLLILLTILAGIAVGWSIGANDAANSLGTAVGSRVVTLRQALILIVIFGFLGAWLQGGNVVKTIGKGIVPLDGAGDMARACFALATTLAAVAWVVLATYWKMPISTSHSIVGGAAGAGLALHLPVRWEKLGDIFICWLVTPVGAAILGYIILRFLLWFFARFVPRRWNRPLLRLLIIASGCYVAFSWGANDVANATGVINGAGILEVNASVAIGGLAIVLGIVTWGSKVIETIGTQITRLLPIMAFAAQLASAVNVHLYTLAGIPVSTSHSIVGAIFGCGLVRGARLLNLRIIREIAVCWVATPFISGILSYACLRGIQFWIKI
ncbi:MAG: inorganic phosphate transporter [Kiritimatiellae bacterium]|nr:inorganic phosphate transporter [Kiritimatiellia bacterium]